MPIRAFCFPLGCVVPTFLSWRSVGIPKWLPRDPFSPLIPPGSRLNSRKLCGNNWEDYPDPILNCQYHTLIRPHGPFTGVMTAGGARPWTLSHFLG